MNYKMIGFVNGLILFIETAFMLPPLVISLVQKDLNTAKAFGVSMLIMVVVALLMLALSRKGRQRLSAKESFVCVALSWIVMSVFGALPLYFSESFSSGLSGYVDALFEIVSGFTTTGASVVANVELLPRAILYWRSFTNWIGGMGVLVFLLALVPLGKKNEGFTIHLLKAESPGPDVAKLVPKIRNSAAILYFIYIGLTVLNFVFLVFDMPVFEAVCAAFSTAGTGGFGVKADSFVSYSSYIQNVTTVFMILFGVNFSCYYLLLLKQIKSVFKDEELRLYFGIIIASICLITVNISAMFNSLSEAIRHAAFQVSSIITTTGFVSVDFDMWPSFSKAILLFLMLIGAMAGSTGGGLKCARLLLIFKTMKRNISQLLFPNRVKVIKVNNNVVDERVLSNTNAYLAAYVIIMVISFLVVSIDNFSVETNVSAIVSCFNNTGPGFDAVGPMVNYSGYNILSKLVLSADMLAGRLEIFPILVLLSRNTWKKNS